MTAKTNTSAATTETAGGVREITYAEAIREAMSEEMRKSDDVFLMGEDIGVYGGAFGVSVGMIDEFGEDRIRDTPISEAVIVGAATGAAVTGMRPIAEIQFSDFLTIGMDQLVNQAAKIRYMFGGTAKVPMVVRAPAGSGTGAAAQHSSSMEAWYTHVPGLKVVIPSTPYDAKGLLKAAIADDNPVVFLEQKLLYRVKGPVPEQEYTIPLSSSDVKREGRDLTIVTWGRMVNRCLEVAEELAKEGIEIEIVDPRTLMPLDDAPIIASARKTGRVLVVHEAVQTGGFGGEIVARIADSEAFYYLDAPVKRLGGVDVPVPYNPVLEANVVPTPETITAAVRDLLQ
jgi:pyruvate/2-oxoglutarate/acetoin dehydrogenase E1 component